MREAAALYTKSRSTLYDQIHGIGSRRIVFPIYRNLLYTKSELLYIMSSSWLMKKNVAALYKAGQLVISGDKEPTPDQQTEAQVL